MRDEIDQQIVEEIDEIGTEVLGVLKEQLGDGVRDLAATPRVAAFDDIVQSGNERRGNGHENANSYGARRGCALGPSRPTIREFRPRR